MCEELATHVGISTGSAHTILTRHLQLKKIAARWVPHCLSDVHIQERLASAKEHIHRF